MSKLVSLVALKVTLSFDSLALLKKQENWRTAIQKQNVRRANVMSSDDLSDIPTLSEMKDILQSKAAMEGMATLRMLHGKYNLNKEVNGFLFCYFLN